MEQLHKDAPPKLRQVVAVLGRKQNNKLLKPKTATQRSSFALAT